LRLFVMIQCIIVSFITLWHPAAAVPIPCPWAWLSHLSDVITTQGNNKKKLKSTDEAHYMWQLSRQLLSEAGRHSLLYNFICIFMQAQLWMSEGLNYRKGLPWYTTMNVCTFIIGLAAEILWATSSVIQAGF
jgi:hypothetical protein